MLSTVYRALTLSSPDSSWAARPKTKQRARAYFMVDRVCTCVASYNLKFTLGLGWVWCDGETTGVRRTGPCPVKTFGETGHGPVATLWRPFGRNGPLRRPGRGPRRGGSVG